MALSTAISGLKEDIAELKTLAKEQASAMADMRVLVAGQYVERKECQDAQRANQRVHNMIIGWLLGICTAILAAFGYIATRGGK